MIRIWTDGCCLDNPGGRGGWAFVVERQGVVIHRASGGEAASTNNRMELMALIEALRWLGEQSAEVYSDSQYVVNGATRWIKKWRAQGWRRGGRQKRSNPVKNVDLWQEVDRLHNQSLVDLRWVRGHDGRRFNEEADRLAGNAAWTVEEPAPDEDPAEEFVERFGL